MSATSGLVGVADWAGMGAAGLIEAEVANLAERLAADYPEVRFVQGRKFAFRPPRTVVMGPAEPHDALLMLHEMGHALGGHYTYCTGVERLKIEMEAWEQARGLAARYGVEWHEEVAQGELDSYRDWLHQKSRCPECGLTRFQTPDGAYHCPGCELVA